MKLLITVFFEDATSNDEFETILSSGLIEDLLLELSFPLSDFIYSQMDGAEHMIEMELISGD